MSEKILVICESPNKVSSIKSFLPSNYKVVASVGHISEIRDGGNYWNTGINPDKDFDADFAVSKDKKEIVARLIKLVKESDIILIASDPDREGEAIAWSLKKFLKIPKKDYRKCILLKIQVNLIKN